MPSNWKTSSLKDLSVDVSYGYTESASAERIGPKFLRITDIQNGTVDWQSVPYCPIGPKDHAKYKLARNDIVVARTGNSTGENYLFDGNEDTVYASYLIRFRINPDLADPMFVWYSMRSPKWWGFIKSSKTGSAQAGANAQVLGHYPISLPSISYQRKVSQLLSSIDKKIANNRAQAETLESIARALFKSWFVDFDPVRAKMEGRQPEGMDEETAALFPDRLVESELGLIPEGWEVNSLKDVFVRHKVQNKYTKKSVCAEGGTIVFDQSESMLLGYTDDAPEFNSTPDNPFFYFGDHTCVMRLSTSPFSLGPNAIPLTGKNLPSIWVYHACRDKQNFQEYKRHWAELIIKPVCVPSLSLAKKYAEITTKLYVRIRNVENQNVTLGNLRDTLLPQLLAGKLRLDQAVE